MSTSGATHPDLITAHAHPEHSEHSYTVARWISRHNAGLVTRDRAVAVIADTLVECEGMEADEAARTADHWITINPNL